MVIISKKLEELGYKGIEGIYTIEYYKQDKMIKFYKYEKYMYSDTPLSMEELKAVYEMCLSWGWLE